MAVKALAQVTLLRAGEAGLELVAGAPITLRLEDGTTITPMRPGSIQPDGSGGTPLSLVTTADGGTPPADVWVASDVSRLVVGAGGVERHVPVSSRPGDVASPAEVEAAIDRRDPATRSAVNSALQALGEQVAAKLDKSTADATYATPAVVASTVDEKVAAAQLAGADVDLSAYLPKSEAESTYAKTSDIPAPVDTTAFLAKTEAATTYATKAELPPPVDTSALATKTELSTALSSKVNTSTYTSGLAAKADTTALATKLDASALAVAKAVGFVVVESKARADELTADSAWAGIRVYYPEALTAPTTNPGTTTPAGLAAGTVLIDHDFKTKNANPFDPATYSYVLDGVTHHPQVVGFDGGTAGFLAQSTTAPTVNWGGADKTLGAGLYHPLGQTQAEGGMLSYAKLPVSRTIDIMPTHPRYTGYLEMRLWTFDGVTGVQSAAGPDGKIGVSIRYGAASGEVASSATMTRSGTGALRYRLVESGGTVTAYVKDLGNSQEVSVSRAIDSSKWDKTIFGWAFGSAQSGSVGSIKIVAGDVA